MNSEIYLVGSISIYSSMIIAQYYACVYKMYNLISSLAVGRALEPGRTSALVYRGLRFRFSRLCLVDQCDAEHRPDQREAKLDEQE